MLKVTIKGLLAHKTRFVSTFLAVLLGVGLAFGALLAIADPAGAGAVAILATAVAFTVSQWR